MWVYFSVSDNVVLNSQFKGCESQNYLNCLPPQKNGNSGNEIYSSKYSASLVPGLDALNTAGDWVRIYLLGVGAARFWSALIKKAEWFAYG